MLSVPPHFPLPATTAAQIKPTTPPFPIKPIKKQTFSFKAPNQNPNLPFNTRKQKIKIGTIGIPCQIPPRGLLIPEIEPDSRPRRPKESWCLVNPRKVQKGDS